MRLLFNLLLILACTIHGTFALSLRDAQLGFEVENAFVVIGRKNPFKVTQPRQYREQANARLAQRLERREIERPIFDALGGVNAVHLTRAIDLHELRYLGQGRKLAIIESGFSDRMLEQLQSSGLLLGGSHSGLYGKDDDFTSHGDHVLEVAHNMAPKAQIL